MVKLRNFNSSGSRVGEEKRLGRFNWHVDIPAAIEMPLCNLLGNRRLIRWIQRVAQWLIAMSLTQAAVSRFAAMVSSDRTFSSRLASNAAIEPPPL